MLKSSDEWLHSDKYRGITVLDPDGWNRQDFYASWHEPISEEEFAKRLAVSTLAVPVHMHDTLNKSVDSAS